MSKFWTVMKTDGAIYGLASGSQSRRTIGGPFTTKSEAYKQLPSRHGCTWYTVTESELKPADSSNEYEFVDADREFNDGY